MALTDYTVIWMTMMILNYLFFFYHKPFRKPYIAGFLFIMLSIVLLFTTPNDTSTQILGYSGAIIGAIIIFNNRKGFNA